MKLTGYMTRETINTPRNVKQQIGAKICCAICNDAKNKISKYNHRLVEELRETVHDSTTRKDANEVTGSGE